MDGERCLICKKLPMTKKAAVSIAATGCCSKDCMTEASKDPKLWGTLLAKAEKTIADIKQKLKTLPKNSSLNLMFMETNKTVH